jgi:uncharacterized peroxidase-related enzyme
MRGINALICMVLLGLFMPPHGGLRAEGRAHGAFVPLAAENAEVFTHLGQEALDTPASGRIPNYLRVLAGPSPGAVQPFAHLFKAVLYGGTVAPETKAAMGLRIAKANGSDYLAAHLLRILKTTEKGRALLAMAAESQSTDEKTRVALRYATDLTRAVHGVSDADFARARTVYNDSQLVELTATTCFFNYFARLCQGAGLPLESWVKEPPNALPTIAPENNDTARVTLSSDAEMQMAAKLITPSPELKSGLGIGIANSQRAMLRVPDIGDAWWSYTKAAREGAKLSREMQLHISFAVSMANGCRYCTVHQVVGLRRQGVDIAKLVAMQKDDSALTPRELAAVTFARKLTGTPGTLQETDFAALRSALGEDREAYDALLQTCMFSFMNRFTDGLRLPSEDEAVKAYQEVYGDGAYKAYPHTYNAPGSR